MAFVSPLVLWALVLLPGLWWLLRLTPPAPKRVTFPALRLLLGLTAREETPARTPWWLLLLRLVLCALLIIGLARPLLHPDTATATGSAPLLLLVDTGWAAGRDWPDRQQALDRLVTQAERENRPVLLLATAPSAAGETPQVQGPLSATAARRLVQALAPQPWPSDRAAALAALDTAQKTGPLAGVTADSYWLADGLNDGSVAALAARLRALGRVTVMTAGADHGPLLLRAPNSDAGALMVPVERAEGTQAQPIAVEALGEDGRALGRAEGIFTPGQRQLTLPLTLPGELRNAAVRLHMEDRAGVGATLLLDDRWRRRPVGLATAGPGGDSQPLLSSLYYLDRALAPYAEVRRGTVPALLDGGVSVLVLPDMGALSDGDTGRVARWIDQGGVLVRFGGTRLAHRRRRW
ncbi:BatA domain-containing protein, partial [Azospirillum sp. B4]|uniref:BatA domain-containing protein n=1 Tax=Azospirillum sp. B4 TaxID=95605 RepID=UPI0005C9BCD2